jgi:hypothetical protein
VKTCSAPIAASTWGWDNGDSSPASCLEGYGLAVNTCYPCSAGTYAIDGSTATCTSCPAGTYSPSIGNN